MKVSVFVCVCNPKNFSYVPGHCQKCHREKEIEQREIEPREYCKVVGHNYVSIKRAKQLKQNLGADFEGEGRFCLRCRCLRGPFPESENQVSSGRDSCFVTTACAQALGLGDDCFELQILRKFRDSYIVKLPNGLEVVKEYYSVGPEIVRAISARNNAAELYREVYETTILPCVSLVNEGAFEKAFQLYGGKVRELADKFLGLGALVL